MAREHQGEHPRSAGPCADTHPEDNPITPEQRKTLATFMRSRATECRDEARKDIEDALALTLDPMGDPARIEDLLSSALVNMGETRGFYNAASDIDEGDAPTQDAPAELATALDTKRATSARRRTT